MMSGTYLFVLLILTPNLAHMDRVDVSQQRYQKGGLTWYECQLEKKYVQEKRIGATNVKMACVREVK